MNDIELNKKSWDCEKLSWHERMCLVESHLRSYESLVRNLHDEMLKLREQNYSREQILRDQFAMAALNAIMKSVESMTDADLNYCAYKSYIMADAMLEARKV